MGVLGIRKGKEKFNSSPIGCVRAYNGLENYSNVGVAFKDQFKRDRIHQTGGV